MKKIETERQTRKLETDRQGHIGKRQIQKDWWRHSHLIERQRCNDKGKQK